MEKLAHLIRVLSVCFFFEIFVRCGELLAVVVVGCSVVVVVRLFLLLLLSLLVCAVFVRVFFFGGGTVAGTPPFNDPMKAGAQRPVQIYLRCARGCHSFPNIPAPESMPGQCG